MSNNVGAPVYRTDRGLKTQSRQKALSKLADTGGMIPMSQARGQNRMTLVVVVELTDETLIFQNPKSFPGKTPYTLPSGHSSTTKFGS